MISDDLADSTLRAAHESARALGWFSIGLGAAELLAPRAVGRLIGLRGHEGLLRCYGLREIVAGVGILRGGDPTPWLWARVAGDALDLATLGAGLARSENRLATLLAIGAVGGVTLADIGTAQVLSAANGDARPAWDGDERAETESSDRGIAARAGVGTWADLPNAGAAILGRDAGTPGETAAAR